GLTFIPLNPKSSFSFYLSGHLNGRKYHNDFSLFDNNSGDIMAAIGYRPTTRLLLRTGVSFTSTAYINSEIPYKRDLELFAGTHISLPASNSLDIEAGWARSNYEYIDIDLGRLTDAIGFIDSLKILAQLTDTTDNVAEKLKSFYYSIRLSRPLPLKSGLSLVYTNRIFQNDDHNIVYGFTTGYLSPWATLWEGENVTLKLKSFALPGVILTGGIGYWDKTFLRTAEEDDASIRHLENNEHRRDYLTRWYASAQLPIVSGSGWFLEQNIKVERTSNRSTKPDIYTYQDVSVTAGFVVRF
ncbi:MAG: hypothetical protein GY841_01630, partial [FCB group bacterium]|nr:hypothetical protein [FCB group bacterium]